MPSLVGSEMCIRDRVKVRRFYLSIFQNLLIESLLLGERDPTLGLSTKVGRAADLDVALAGVEVADPREEILGHNILEDFGAEVDVQALPATAQGRAARSVRTGLWRKS